MSAAERRAIRVLLVDDHPIVLLGLRLFTWGLSSVRDLFGEADNGFGMRWPWRESFCRTSFLMDLEMPAAWTGLAATAMLRPTSAGHEGESFYQCTAGPKQILSTLKRRPPAAILLKEAPMLQLVKSDRSLSNAGGTCFPTRRSQGWPLETRGAKTPDSPGGASP